MAALTEDFYRCSECDNATFIEEQHLVVKHDPDFMYPEDYLIVKANTVVKEYKYRCTKCGKYLSRGAR